MAANSLSVNCRYLWKSGSSTKTIAHYTLNAYTLQADGGHGNREEFEKAVREIGEMNSTNRPMAVVQ
jgi:hypothetical protein